MIRFLILLGIWVLLGFCGILFYNRELLARRTLDVHWNMGFMVLFGPLAFFMIYWFLRQIKVEEETYYDDEKD